MKNFLFALFLLSSLVLPAQTHVWGGIYSNTIWLKANSPYIVDSLLVIFPGVKLDIQAGVTVKFKQGVSMEVRQSTLSLSGTANDSIFFTSDAVAPQTGDWKGVYLNGGTLGALTQYFNLCYSDSGFYKKNYFGSYVLTDVTNSSFHHNNFVTGGFRNVSSCFFMSNGMALNSPKYTGNSTFNNNEAGIVDAKGLTENCVFKYNQSAIMGSEGTTKKCMFLNNLIGISSISKGLTYPVVDSCVFKKNTIGIRRASYVTITNNSIDSNQIGIRSIGKDHIEKNIIRNNLTGIEEAADPDVGWAGANTIIQNTISSNSIGLEVIAFNDEINCNTICNNSTYNLKYLGTSNTILTFARRNTWCSSDSATVASTIYDGYDNVAAGLVSFVPLDATTCEMSVGLIENSFPQNILIYPNPSTGQFNINCPEQFTGTLRVLDLHGALVYKASITNTSDHSFHLNVAPGIYLCELNGDKTFISRQKIVVRD